MAQKLSELAPFFQLKTGKFEEKRAATGRQMKISQILRHAPTQLFSLVAGDFEVARFGG